MRLFLTIVILLTTAIAITLLYHQTQQADINYYQGHKFFEKGEYDKAMKFCEKTLAIDPTHEGALTDLAYSCQWTGDFKRAIETFNKILSMNPGDYKIMMALAESLAWNKEYEKSIAVCEEIINSTGDIKAQILLGQVCIWNKQFDSAKEVLEEVLRKDPDNSQAKLLYAKALHYSGEAKDAVEIYEELLKERKMKEEITEEKEIKKLLGEASAIGKDYKKAIQKYKEILKDEPEDIEVRIALADVLSWNKKYDEAIQEYKEILKAEPDNLNVKGKLANIYSWKKNYREAENLYKDIIKENPENLDAYISLAQILIWDKRYSEALRYFDIVLSKKENENLLVLYGQALLYSGDYKQAREVFEKVLAEEPSNAEAKIYLADIYTYSKEFDKAIAIYKEVLEQKEDLEIKRKLADVLSWDKKYGKAIKLYNEILNEGEDKKVRLQKARALGWAREYRKSLKEYRKILEFEQDNKIALEMRAKRAYWDGRVRYAINYYNKLIEKDPDNVETMFDLSQIYSYQYMWKDAIKEYKRILDIYPTHFRAKEGLQKAELISEHILFKTGYEYFKAESSSRDSDIRRNTSFFKLSFPASNNLHIDAGHRITYRNFIDSSEVLENKSKINIAYINNPAWRIESFYAVFAYNRDIDTMHNFGGNFNFRIFDIGTSQFDYKRERLENNSTVIKKKRYRDSFKERINLDINKNLKAGADYLFSYYSDDNYKHEPAFDILYYLSLEPMKFSVKYRYFYRTFDERKEEYFSPKRFTTNAITFNWRHFLNKEEIFFGADDLYYDLKYDLTIDSKDIVGHKFSGELNWDINKRLNFNIQGSITNTSAGVYDDRSLITSIKYYF